MLGAMASGVRRRLALLASALAVFAVGAGFGLVLVKRMETGHWQLPRRADLARVVKAPIELVTGPPRPEPARIIYLARRPVQLTPAEQDDAPTGASSVAAGLRKRPVLMPGWSGSDKGWTEVVRCVRGLFARFAVEVTERKPTTGGYVLVAVGGRPGDLGVSDRHIGGLAPFNGDVIARPVVFAFARQLGNQPRTVCETIAMEVAHTYGLDHEYQCKDVMTYRKPCGPKTFTDLDARCGELAARDCAGGAATQNSFRRLLAVLGPSRSTVEAPPPRPGATATRSRGSSTRRSATAAPAGGPSPGARRDRGGHRSCCPRSPGARRRPRPGRNPAA